MLKFVELSGVSVLVPTSKGALKGEIVINPLKRIRLFAVDISTKVFQEKWKKAQTGEKFLASKAR